MSELLPGFKLSAEFPNEAFVQAAIMKFFVASNHEAIPARHSDYSCRHRESGELWVIEAKGATSAVGLDFRTGLGQLIQRAENPSALYGLAFPNISSFLFQARQVPKWIRERIRIHWLVVNDDSSVRMVKPSEEV